MSESFRQTAPVAWHFHRNTMRWAHTVEPPGGEIEPLPARENCAGTYLKLPELRGAPADFFELVRLRHSCREFANQSVSIEQLSVVLSAGYGMNGRTVIGRLEFDERPVPSGGGLYPLELSLYARDAAGVAVGIHHYLPVTHGLECVLEGPLPASFREYLFMGQAQLASAPVIIIITGSFCRNMRKYGDRGYRYMLYEAGHVAQNINLAAAAIGLGSCNIGGFFDKELGDALMLDQDAELPLYAVAIGVPISADRNENRSLGKTG
jgi:SagB-type dehydrogenase family enzyme